jgi:hypothetical protein
MSTVADYSVLQALVWRKLRRHEGAKRDAKMRPEKMPVKQAITGILFVSG